MIEDGALRGPVTSFTAVGWVATVGADDVAGAVGVVDPLVVGWGGVEPAAVLGGATTVTLSVADCGAASVETTVAVFESTVPAESVASTWTGTMIEGND